MFHRTSSHLCSIRSLNHAEYLQQSKQIKEQYFFQILILTFFELVVLGIVFLFVCVMLFIHLLKTPFLYILLFYFQMKMMIISGWLLFPLHSLSLQCTMHLTINSFQLLCVPTQFHTAFYWGLKQ